MKHAGLGTTPSVQTCSLDKGLVQLDVNLMEKKRMLATRKCSFTFLLVFSDLCVTHISCSTSIHSDEEVASVGRLEILRLQNSCKTMGM